MQVYFILKNCVYVTHIYNKEEKKNENSYIPKVIVIKKTVHAAQINQRTNMNRKKK